MQCEFTNGLLMMTGALFDHGQRLLDGPSGFEIVRAQHCIGEVAEVHRRFSKTEQPMLRDNENGQDPMLVEIGGQLVQLVDEVPLPGHGVQVSIQTVNDHQLGALPP